MITLAASASRLSGVAPLGVTFNATETTSTTTSKPFHDLDYKWRFGDSGAGTWSGGARPGSSKNIAYGPVTGHVYETPGTYTVTVTVHDGEDTQEETFEITVTDPDTVFSGENTVCISNDTDHTGAPAGALTVDTTSDFDASLATYLATGKRVLFKRGDTFTSSAAGSIASAGAMTVGAYGTGNDPIVNGTNITGIISITNTAVNDLRVMDLDIRGNGATDTGAGLRLAAVAVDNVTVLRCSITEIGEGMSVTSGGGFHYSIFQENAVSNYYESGGNAFFGRAIDSAFLGNDFGPVATGSSGEHVLRLQRGQRTALQHNTLTKANTAKHALTIRGSPHVTDDDDTYYVLVSDNKLVGELEDWLVHIKPSADNVDERDRDILFERNWLVVEGTTTDRMIVTSGIRVTVRNNVAVLGTAAGAVFIEVSYSNEAGLPTPDDTVIVGNSVYGAATSGTKDVVVIDTEPTNVTVYNNVAYSPGSDAGDMIDGTGASGLDAGNNSTDAQIVGTAPFTDTTPADPNNGDFTPADYALTGGGGSVKNYRDFFGNFRGSALEMGAVALTTEDDPAVEEEPSSDGLVERVAFGRRRRTFAQLEDRIVEVSGYKEAERLLSQIKTEEKFQEKERKKLKILLGRIEDRKPGILYEKTQAQIQNLEKRIDKRDERIEKLSEMILKRIEELNEDDEEVLLLS